MGEVLAVSCCYMPSVSGIGCRVSDASCQVSGKHLREPPHAHADADGCSGVASSS